MPRTIPPRLPIADVINGELVQGGGQTALRVNPSADAVVVRYGLRYLGKPHLSIVPGLVAIDYGTILNGEEAWEFLLKRSNVYPRAEIFGYRNDGRDEMVYVKQIDFSEPLDVLAYADDTASTPAASLSALIAHEPSALPPRLAAALPQFATLAEWQNAVQPTDEANPS